MGPAAVSHLIFDLDGTLTDSREGFIRSVSSALERLGVEVPPPMELSKLLGPPIQEVFTRLLGTNDPARVQQGIRLYRERYSEVGLFENTPYPAIHETLSLLRSEGFRLWVCTSKPWPFAERILERFDLASYFQGIYGCELDGERSRKSELLAYLLEREAIEPARAAMIGDREHDALAARSNGTRSIGVLYGFGDEAELRAAGAETLCASAAGLPECVFSLPFVEGRC